MIRSMPSEEDLVEAAEAYNAAWNARDFAALRGLYREDAVMVATTPPFVSDEFSTRLDGVDEIIRCFEMLLANEAGTISHRVTVPRGRGSPARTRADLPQVPMLEA